LTYVSFMEWNQTPFKEEFLLSLNRNDAVKTRKRLSYKQSTKCKCCRQPSEKESSEVQLDSFIPFYSNKSNLPAGQGDPQTNDVSCFVMVISPMMLEGNSRPSALYVFCGHIVIMPMLRMTNPVCW